METKLATTLTRCDGCIFAQIDGGDSQTGCKLNNLEKFAKQGAWIGVDIDTNRCVIHNRVCIFKFTQEQWDKHPEIKNPATDLRERIKLSCTIYVLVTDDKLDLKTTLDSLATQTLQAKLIHVVICTDKMKVAHANVLLRDLDRRYPDFSAPWQVTTIVDRDEDNIPPSMEWCIDHAVHSCQTPAYAVFTAGFEVPSDYLSSIDKALNDDLMQFIVLDPVNNEGWDGVFVHTGAHRMVDGNYPMKLEEYDDGALISDTVYDKIIYFSKQEKQEHLVKKVEEICPAMLK